MTSNNIDFKNYLIIVSILFLCVSPVFPPFVRVVGFLIIYLFASKNIQLITKGNLLIVFFFVCILLYATVLDTIALTKYGFNTASF